MTTNQDELPVDAEAEDAAGIPAEGAVNTDALFAQAELVDDEVAAIVTPPPTLGRPVLSPDGDRIALFNADVHGIVRLWIGSVDGGDFTPLDLDVDLLADLHGPRWSPDGTQLVITAPHPADGRSSIWVVQIEQAFARLLVDHHSVDSGPVWSPDGAWIAFLSQRDGRIATTVIPADGLGTPIQVSSANPGFNDHSLTWSRDSSRIAYAQQAVDGDKLGDHIFTFDLKTGTSKQVTTRLCGRRELTWAPDRNLIMHIANDAEWEQIAVVNADNSSGWNIAAEKGDKSNPAWSHDGQRVTYVRHMEGVVRVIERGTSTATSEPIDPGDGSCRWPQFTSTKNVLYVYESISAAPAIYVQEPNIDAERLRIDVNPEWSPLPAANVPQYQPIQVGDVQSGALVYRWSEQSGPIPAVIVLRDRPQDPHSINFNVLEQALSAEGFIIVVPTLPGSPGEGKKLANALADRVDTEGDFDDLIAVINAVKEIAGVDAGRIAVVGVGQGGAAAITLAGSRPGLMTALAAIDPVADWNAEFDAADTATRSWILRTFGLPASNQGRYAMRTPSTFAGIIETPLLLMGTESAPAGRSAQLDGLANLLRDLDRPFIHEVSIGESEWDAMRRVASFIRESLLAVPATRVETAEAVTADSV